MSASQRGCASRSDASAGMADGRPRPPASARLLTGGRPHDAASGSQGCPRRGQKGTEFFLLQIWIDLLELFTVVFTVQKKSHPLTFGSCSQKMRG